MDLQTTHCFEAVPLQIPHVWWQATGLHELVGVSKMKPLLHWQTPAERKAFALQDVQVVEVPLQVEQEGSQAAHKLLTSLKNPTLQKQVPPLKVERAPEQPVH